MTCSHRHRPAAYKRSRAAASGEHNTPTSLHCPVQQGDVALKAYVTSVCFNCLRYFRGMLHVFYMDVSKMDRDVAHVTMVAHVCCKRLFKMFHLFFQTYVVSVFIWMLHMFYTYVVSVLSACCVCLQWFSSVFRCFCKCFRRMFQVLHLSSFVCCKCCI